MVCLCAAQLLLDSSLEVSPEHVMTVDLTSQGISSINSTQFDTFVNLKVLNLSDNRLSVLAGLCQLPALQQLAVSANRLRGIASLMQPQDKRDQSCAQASITDGMPEASSTRSRPGSATASERAMAAAPPASQLMNVQAAPPDRHQSGSDAACMGDRDDPADEGDDRCAEGLSLVADAQIERPQQARGSMLAVQGIAEWDIRPVSECRSEVESVISTTTPANEDGTGAGQCNDEDQQQTGDAVHQWRDTGTSHGDVTSSMTLPDATAQAATASAGSDGPGGPLWQCLELLDISYNTVSADDLLGPDSVLGNLPR